MKKTFGILAISIIIATLSLIFQWKAIIITFALIFIIYCYKNTRKGFWITYFVVLSLPISNNNILKYVTINIGGKGLNVIQISIAIIFCIILIKNNQYKKFKFNNINTLFILLSVMYFIYLLVGISNGHGDRAIVDFSMYVYQILLFYCTYKIVSEKDDIYKLMNITLYGLTTNCVISFFMYLTKGWSIWGVTYSEGRFGGNYLTLCIITMSYAVFLVYNKKNKNTFIIMLSSLLSIILLFLSQNRTTPLLIILSCAILLIINLNNSLSSRNLFSRMSLLTFISIFSIIGMMILLNSEIELVSRFKNMSSLSTDRNIQTRVKTTKYHLDLIKKNPLGSGFGTLMPFIDAEDRIQHEDSLQIDNSYITIARKSGLVAVTVYILLVLSPIKQLINKYKKSRDMIFLSVMISYAMLLIASSLMTSQSIHSYSVSSFIWVFISYTNNLKADVISNEVKDNSCTLT